MIAEDRDCVDPFRQNDRTNEDKALNGGSIRLGNCSRKPHVEKKMKRCFLHLLFLALSASVLSVYADTPIGTSPTFKGPVGVQTYSLRNQIKENGVAALDFLKEQGFKEVEIGIGNHYGMSAEQMRDALRERGLVPIAAHAGYDAMLNRTDEVIKEARFFGLKYVGIAWAAHKAPMDEKQMLKIADDFNTIGKRLKEAGLQFFYHNHGFEFYPYKDGETLFDLLMQKTDPELVKFEMDVLWTVFPGQDAAALLRKYPDRWVLMHLKDLAKGVTGNLSGGTDKDNDVPLGSGQVDYKAVLRAAQEIGIKYYFIEDESSKVLQQIPQSLKFLSTIDLSK